MQEVYSSFKNSSTHVNEETLFRCLGTIFPSTQIFKGARKENAIQPTPGKYLEIDIWIPKYNLCFEFQDTYHYVLTWYSQLNSSIIAEKDYEKRIATHKHGASLISIPCWWNGTSESLCGTIGFYRPDIALISFSSQHLISLNPPQGYFDSPTIPVVGELMLASFPTQFSGLSNNLWWLGEKYDGVRSCWDPTTNTLYARHGMIIDLPSKFDLKFPSIYLDMELWFGRGNFNIAQSVPSASPNHICWDLFRAVAFDIPLKIEHEEYEYRYKLLMQAIVPCHPCNHVVFRMECKQKEIEQIMQMMIEENGEGLILQKQRSQYEHGRSTSLLKFKKSKNEQEGIVIGFGSDQSVAVKLPNNTTFAVEYESVLVSGIAKGDVVSFSCDNNLRLAAPVNPIIFRIRTDLLWEDVVHNFHHNRQVTQLAPAENTTKARNYWTRANIRIYMENFAKTLDADPLKLDTWKKHKYEFLRLNSSKWIVNKFQNCYFKAVEQIFPEISNASVGTKQYYNKVQNRRKFFESFAARHGFDPLVAENWYSLSRNKIYATKGGITVMYYHKDNVPSALISLFPNIGLELSKFIYTKDYWLKKENKRKFFEKYAEERKFDPLVPENWYPQLRSSLMCRIGGKPILKQYSKVPPLAIIDVFPDIGLDLKKFIFWSSYPEVDPNVHYKQNQTKM